MNKKEKKLIGALIGLAKACNVHLKTENTDGIIIKSLASIFPLEENGEELLQRVREEKLAVAPDCATCFAWFLIRIAREPVKNAAKNMIIKVTG